MRKLRGGYKKKPILSVKMIGSSDQNQENLRFDYDITVPSNKEIQVQVFFANALEVSQ